MFDTISFSVLSHLVLCMIKEVFGFHSGRKMRSEQFLIREFSLLKRLLGLGTLCKLDGTSLGHDSIVYCYIKEGSFGFQSFMGDCFFLLVF